MVWEAWRFFDHGRITRYYVEPGYQFRWLLFEWVRPLPGPGMYAVFVLIAAAGLLVALGWRYRLAAPAATLLLAYVFLLDKAQYLNHLYLVILLGAVLSVVPADRVWSLDARRRPSESAEVPAWSVWLLRFQVAVPYVFAGLAKLNHDWIVRAEPLRGWVADDTGFPLMGPLFEVEPVVRGMAVGSALIDLFAPFLLLHRRTRVPAFGAVLAFHLVNSRVFGIGVFPWLMILATPVLFPADWPRRMLTDLRGRTSRLLPVLGGFAGGFVLGGWIPETFSGVRATVGGVGVAVLVWIALALGERSPGVDPEGTGRDPAMPRRAVAWGLAAWVAIQLLVPLRHVAVPGHVSWTEEGHRFSWHMLLRSKDARGAFLVTAVETGERRWVDPRTFLTDRQTRKMWSRPDMILQFAHELEHRMGTYLEGDLEVRAHVLASLNGRGERALIDPEVDLTGVRRLRLPPADWVVPLDTSGS